MRRQPSSVVGEQPCFIVIFFKEKRKKNNKCITYTASNFYRNKTMPVVQKININTQTNWKKHNSTRNCTALHRFIPPISNWLIDIFFSQLDHQFKLDRYLRKKGMAQKGRDEVKTRSDKHGRQLPSLRLLAFVLAPVGSWRSCPVRSRLHFVPVLL